MGQDEIGGDPFNKHKTSHSHKAMCDVTPFTLTHRTILSVRKLSVDMPPTRHSCFQFSSQSSLQFRLATYQAGRRRWERGGARDYGRRARRHWASPAVRVTVTVRVTARAKVRVRIAPRLPRYAGGTTGPRDWYACPVRAVRGALGASGPAPLVRTVRRGLVRVARTCTVRRPRGVR